MHRYVQPYWMTRTPGQMKANYQSWNAPIFLSYHSTISANGTGIITCSQNCSNNVYARLLARRK